MLKLLAKYPYVISFIIICASSIYLNFDCPPNYDEAHAWNIARFLSPIEIFTISKTEGHPFLWYYILMPLAKTNFFYPYSLYLLNLIIILVAFYKLHKHSSFPQYTIYLIALSSPFLQLYTAFSRSYSLTILLLFTTLSIYPKRHKKIITFLTLIILLANTNLIGLIIAMPLGLIYLHENIIRYKNFQTSPNFWLILINFILIEIFLLLSQFYGYDKTPLVYTPSFRPITEDFNHAFYPLNITSSTIFAVSILIMFLKNKRFQSAFFLLFTISSLLTLFIFFYHGAIHHHYFFYICIISSYWLANIEKTPHLSHKLSIPLSILAFLLIFNPYATYKTKDKKYLQELRQSAYTINNTYTQNNIDIYFPEYFNANIILPYLNNNVTLYNQKFIDLKKLKSFQEPLYNIYKPINIHTLTENIKQKPHTVMYKNCGELDYYNTQLTIHKIQKLNSIHCLYDIKFIQHPNTQQPPLLP